MIIYSKWLISVYIMIIFTGLNWLYLYLWDDYQFEPFDRMMFNIANMYSPFERSKLKSWKSHYYSQVLANWFFSTSLPENCKKKIYSETVSMIQKNEIQFIWYCVCDSICQREDGKKI